MAKKVCTDCSSFKGICIYCNNKDCYSEPVKPVKFKPTISNYSTFILDKDIENDMFIEDCALIENDNDYIYF